MIHTYYTETVVFMIRTHLSWASFEVKSSADGLSNAFRFESLCRQLFVNKFTEKESHQRFLQSVVNNPGIETEPIYDEKKKTWIGFQAKYFSKKISYNAILDSCTKAVTHYKDKLDELVLFCNLQPYPSAKTYKATKDLLKSNGITLTLIAGDTIFDLVREYDNLKEYYFGQPLMSDEWIREHDECMVKLLGDRFEAGFNVSTESEVLLSLFSLDSNALEYVNKKKKAIQNEIDSIYWKHPLHRKYLIRLYKAVEKLSDVYANNISDAFEWYELVRQEVIVDINEIMSEKSELEQKNKDLLDKNKDDASDRNWYQEYDGLYDAIKNLEELVQLPELLRFSDNEKSLITGKVLAVSGEAGTGKSHLFAHETKVLLEEGRSPLFLFAGMYSSNNPIKKQIMENCGLNFTFNELISILEMKGVEKRSPIMLFIDALNETTDRSLWEMQLPAIVSQIEKCSFVRLAFSFRPEYREEILSENIRKSIKDGEICHFEHAGFKDISIKAARDFFNYYNISFGLYEFFQTNMDNPLFLKLYCKTYEGDEVSLPDLYDRLIYRASENIWKNMSHHLYTLGYSKSDNILQPLIYELVKWFASHSKRSISKKEILALNYWQEYRVTPLPFLKKVIEEGILITFPGKKEDETEDYYSFTFDQMNDYFLAKAIVMSSQSEEEIRSKILNDILLIRDRVINLISCDLFINICALYAEKYGKECIDILDNVDDSNKGYIINRYILSFKWRRKETIRKDEFLYLLRKYQPLCSTVYDVLIHNSVKYKHPLNAEFLHSLLYSLPLNKRDHIWTSVINLLEEISPRALNLIELYDSGDKLNGMGRDQARLLLVLLSWFLTATNRELRDRASKAMIEILKIDFNLCLPILKKFESVNDPYIIQRLYGIIFGACSKRIEPHTQEFQELAEYIYITIFSKDEVYPDILLRDYARLTIELFLTDNPEYSGPIDKTRISPPYRSAPIPKIGEDFSKNSFSEEHYGSSLIKSSMDLEEFGWYGDFGRYVFERALKRFDVDILNLYNYAIVFIRDELEYKDSLFNDIDRKINQKTPLSSRLSKCVERIGKKYQWIAFYNILARVADNCPMISSGLLDYKRNDSKYEGPWDPYVRDFDPTLNEHFLASTDTPLFDELENYFKQSQVDSFNNDISNQEWLETPRFFLEKLGDNLIQKDENGFYWVILDGYFKPGHDSHIQNVYTQWALLHAFFIPSKAFSFLSKDSNWKRSFPWNILQRYESYTLFNREYPWSLSCNELREREQESELFILEAANGQKRQIEFKGFLHATDKFSWEEEYDYSKKERIDWRMPCTELVKELELYRKECDSTFYDKENRLAAFDLRFTHNCEAVALRQDLLDEFLKKTEMKLVWFIQAEKCIQNEETYINKAYKEMIGFYHYNRKKISGEMGFFEQ